MQIFKAAQQAKNRFAIVACHKLVRSIPGESQIGAWELKASFQNRDVAKRMFKRALAFTGAELVALIDRQSPVSLTRGSVVIGMLQR
jgi:hypothetical protein